jgi:thiol-disulfide isomerase/thioredoxin
MRVRAIALALAAAVVLGSAGCAPESLKDARASENADGSVNTEGVWLDADPDPAASGSSDAPATEVTAVPSPSGKPAGKAKKPAPAPTKPRPPRPKTPAGLDFTATTVNGKAFNGASLAGKPTVLWFWAPWCPTCHGQVPEVLRTAEQYAGKANIVGVAGLDRAAPIKKFVTERNLGTFTNLSDTSGAVWKHFTVKQQGYYVLIDPRGKVRYTGWVMKGDLAGQIDRLSR